MATTKNKSTTSKATNAKKTPRIHKKSQIKKSASRHQTVKSFRVSKPEAPFFTFSLTRQTVYWLVLGFVVVIFALWITKLQSDIQSIYDTIDLNSAEQDMYAPLKKQ